MQIHVNLSPELSLRSLCVLRGCAILGLVATIIGSHYGLRLSLPLVPITALAIALSVWTLLTLLRLRRPWVVTQAEIFIHLAVDSIALTVLFYLSGGPGNPFVSFYLVPIAIGAVMLPRLWAWAVTLTCIILYSWLMTGFSQHGHLHAAGKDFQLHVLGMWLNFLLSAIFVTVFVNAIAETVRRRDRELAAAREEALRSEQILAVGTLAAGAAHELSTPLSTMAVTIGELREQHRQNPSLLSDLQLLQEQIEVCRKQLDLLLSSTTQNHALNDNDRLFLVDFLQAIVERHQLIRPEIGLQAHFTEGLATIQIRNEHSLAQAILAALNNAADASRAAGQATIRLHGYCEKENLYIEIQDQGKGLRPEQMALAGRGIFSTKPQGYGLGLVLSHATLERLGGEMQLETLDRGGTLVRIRVPLQALQPTPTQPS